MAEAPETSDPYIQAQIAARKSPAVIKTRFLHLRSRCPGGLLFAVEGDDDKVVYSHWLARTNPELPYEFFVCGGKRGVRQLRNSLFSDKSSSHDDVIFFVDRDFDDLTGFASTSRVFMLDRYSIENYLVCRDVLDSSLKCAYPGDADPIVRNKVCKQFEEDYLSFLLAASDLNKRVFIARKLSLDIDNAIPNSLANIASVELGAIVPSGKSMHELLPLEPEPPVEMISHLDSEFSDMDPKLRHRGKFAFKFLRTWLERLADEYRTSKIGLFELNEPPVAKIKYEELSLGSLASRARLPIGFEEFIRAEIK